ncbi:MAG: hypothetical protein ABEJ72_01075 [Candidatus Aenigmatarchaeota archaeon]
MSTVEETVQDLEQKYEDIQEMESAVNEKAKHLKEAESDLKEVLRLEESGDMEQAEKKVRSALDHLRKARGIDEVEEEDAWEI